MRPRSVAARAVLLATVLAPLPLHAAFTPEEQQQVRALYGEARAGTAAKTRALLARPDHTDEDVRMLAMAAMRNVPFDEEHRAFLHDVLHGTGSDAARNTLAPALVSGALAREEDVFRAHAADLDDHLAKTRGAGEELVRLHAFIATDVASPGHPPDNGHDASIQIRDDALRSALDAYVAHVKQNGRWLHAGEPTTAATVFDLRCQVGATLSELSRGLLPKSAVADALGLTGALRATFERTGTIVLADGQLSEDRAKAVTRALEAVPGFADHAEMVVLGKRMPRGLATRAAVLQVDAPASSKPVPLDGPLWPASIDGEAPDALLALAALEGARVGAKALAAEKPAIAAAMNKASAEARERGESAYLSLDVLGAASDEDRAQVAKIGLPGPVLAASATRLVIVDMPRALDAALVRAIEGRYEALRQLLLGITVLATPIRSATPLTTVPAGRTHGDGAIENMTITDIKVDGAGLVTAFRFDGHTFVFTDGNKPTVTRDGGAIGISMLKTARLPKVEGDTWQGIGHTWKRLTGSPRVGLADDGRVRIVPSRAGGFDAIGFDAPKEVSFSADLVVDSAAAALIVRARPGQASFAGIAAVITPGSPSTLQLLSSDGGMTGDRLTDPVTIADQGETGWHVELVVEKDRVTATIGDRTVAAALPAGFEDASVALAVRGPGYAEARKIVAEKPTKKKPGKKTAAALSPRGAAATSKAP